MCIFANPNQKKDEEYLKNINETNYVKEKYMKKISTKKWKRLWKTHKNERKYMVQISFIIHKYNHI